MAARHYLAATIAATALVAAACGGGDDAATTTAAAPGSTATTAAASTTAAPASTAAPTTAAPATSAAPATDLYHRDLTVGACFDTLPAGDTSVVTPLDCAQPHDNEIFGEGTYQGTEVEFPSTDVLGKIAFDEICNPAYTEFAGFDPRTGPIPFTVFGPDAASWALGDRRFLCVINSPGSKLIGTAASAALDVPRLRVMHAAIVDGQVDLFVSQQGEEPLRITSDLDEEQTFPPSYDAANDRVIYSRFADAAKTQADIVSYDPTTKTVTPLLATDADESNPQLSPDGTKIVFVSNAAGEGEYDIWVMDADGSNPKRLTDNLGRDANPSWSPDGTQIVYRATQAGGDNSDIWIIGVDGSGLTQLTDDPAGDFDPVFGPGGKRIAFTSKRSGNYDIWLMNADGSNPVNLTNHPAEEEYPSWTADGKGLTFTSDRVIGGIWVMEDDGSNQTLFTTLLPSAHGASIGPLG